MTDKEIQKLIVELEKEANEIKIDEKKVEALEKLAEVALMYAGEDRVLPSYVIASMLKAKPPQKKLLSNHTTLDGVLDGFRQKQLIVLSGITKHGKTSFAIDLTSRMKEHYPLWLPFEEPAEELIQKFIDRGEEPPLFYAPGKMVGNNLDWIEKKIIESKAKFGTEIVFIDHLHFIVEMTGENMSHKIGHTMRCLKQIANRWNVAIVLLAHLTKTKLDENPNLENLRDSSFVAQEADTVIILWRETKRSSNGEITITNNVNVSIQANRRTGKTGNVKMAFKDGKFWELDWKHEDDPIKRELAAW